MNAQRSHTLDRANEALAGFSDTLDASLRGAVDSLEFIETNPGSANSVNQTEQPEGPARSLRRRARQLARLIKVIGENFGGVPENIQDAEIIGLAADLADSVYKQLESASDEGPDGAYVKSAHLMAVVFSMYASIPQCARAKTDEERLALANRFGWLQDVADDMARDLAAMLDASGVAEDAK